MLNKTNQTFPLKDKDISEVFSTFDVNVALSISANKAKNYSSGLDKAYAKELFAVLSSIKQEQIFAQIPGENTSCVENHQWLNRVVTLSETDTVSFAEKASKLSDEFKALQSKKTNALLVTSDARKSFEHNEENFKAAKKKLSQYMDSCRKNGIRKDESIVEQMRKDITSLSVAITPVDCHIVITCNHQINFDGNYKGTSKVSPTKAYRNYTAKVKNPRIIQKKWTYCDITIPVYGKDDATEVINFFTTACQKMSASMETYMTQNNIALNSKKKEVAEASV